MAKTEAQSQGLGPIRVPQYIVAGFVNRIFPNLIVTGMGQRPYKVRLAHPLFRGPAVLTLAAPVSSADISVEVPSIGYPKTVIAAPGFSNSASWTGVLDILLGLKAGDS